MKDDKMITSFARDSALMKLVGMNPVVVHGAGPQIGAHLERLGKQSEFIEGMRVTDAETMDFVGMIRGGRVNKAGVAQLNPEGVRWLGLARKHGGENSRRANKITRK